MDWRKIDKTHPKMQRQAQQQGEKGRSGLTGSAFCLQTVNIARFLRLRKYSLLTSISLSPDPRLCSVTKYSCDARIARCPGPGQKLTVNLRPPGTSDQSEASTRVTWSVPTNEKPGPGPTDQWEARTNPFLWASQPASPDAWIVFVLSTLNKNNIWGRKI